MTRRNFLAAPAVLAAQARRPNVVLIMTDDQGYGDLSCHGNPHVKTPNVDRLAAQGTEFTRFTVSPVCAPTRASLMTGRYAMRCGVHGVTAGRETMHRDEITLGKAMQGAGYRTALVGKWHLGENYPYVPHAMGFDEFTGFRLGHWSRYFDSPTERNGKPANLKGYVSDALTDEALRFIEANRLRPYFLYLAYNAPHSPYQVPDKYFDRFRGLKDDELAAIYGMVENLDDNIGRVLGALDDNTIVIYLQDNGPQTDRFNGGLRGRKGQVYEGGTRSPFFIKWPGRISAGKKVAAIAGHIDVYPTVLDLCGVTPPAGKPIDGVSLRPMLEGKSAPGRMIFSHADHQPDPLKPYPGAVRTQRFKMVNGAELYDLEADPGERNNLAAANPDELKRLNTAYDAWFRDVTHGFRTGHPPIPAGYAEENPAVLSAPQAKLEGGTRFFAKSGFAHDFITGWEQTGAKASWEIEVVSGGRYELVIEYLAAPAHEGQNLQVRVGNESLEARIDKATPAEPNILPERSEHRTAAPDMNWATLRFGRMPLEPGIKQLTIEGKMLHLKSVRLRRIPR
ncbi:MAG: arylsulfatase [Bryobacteraceae bacterium]